MNNELIESERALNCIIENYVNELQRNTCDDDEEDMRIYKEKIDLIANLKERILKDLEILKILRELIEIIPNNSTDTKKLLNIRIYPLHMIDDGILWGIHKWLNEKNE